MEFQIRFGQSFWKIRDLEVRRCLGEDVDTAPLARRREIVEMVAEFRHLSVSDNAVVNLVIGYP